MLPTTFQVLRCHYAACFVSCYRVVVLLVHLSCRDMQKLKKIVNNHCHFWVCCFVGNLVGAIVNNMKDYLNPTTTNNNKPTSKKLYIYSAVSKQFLLYLFLFSLILLTLTSCPMWPNVWVSISLLDA